MSESIDRRQPGSGTLVITVMVVVLLAAGAGGYYWLSVSGMPKPSQVRQQENALTPAARPNEPFTATVYLPAGSGLATVVVPVKREFDAQLQAREAVAAVFSADRGQNAAVLKDLRLRTLYLDANGTAYLDLAPGVAGQREVRASAHEELLAVYALVNSVTHNIPEARQVRIILDGREAQTLAGHIDLSRSFVKRIDLVRNP